ncbi:hypothetical protein KGM_215789 [Danaus plexippus plexippus]|uniref:Uncharacterized protein n=1 Tax=Danaus plexippus plexippus TaxID=278856 RepID=A0A212F1W1_DANPL|nr:hypothetical protein KGM_215789 [Danaus plexippus plexippus]
METSSTDSLEAVWKPVESRSGINELIVICGGAKICGIHCHTIESYQTLRDSNAKCGEESELFSLSRSSTIYSHLALPSLECACERKTTNELNPAEKVLREVTLSPRRDPTGYGLLSANRNSSGGVPALNVGLGHWVSPTSRGKGATGVGDHDSLRRSAASLRHARKHAYVGTALSTCQCPRYRASVSVCTSMCWFGCRPLIDRTAIMRTRILLLVATLLLQVHTTIFVANGCGLQRMLSPERDRPHLTD